MIKLLKWFTKKIERLNEHELGYYEGEHCNRHFCPGEISLVAGVCACSTCGHPPCHYCTDQSHYCETCGWEE